MSVMSGPNSAGLVARVQNILMRPAAEWDVIAAEPATTQGLFTGYACILALAPLVGVKDQRDGHELRAGVIGTVATRS